MSKQIDKIPNSGRDEVELTFTSMNGGDKGQMLQLTQGLGNDLATPGYIQLTLYDAYRTVDIITRWIKTVTEANAVKLQKQMEEYEELRNTLIKDTVECQRFIDDLKLLNIPLKLHSIIKGA